MTIFIGIPENVKYESGYVVGWKSNSFIVIIDIINKSSQEIEEKIVNLQKNHSISLLKSFTIDFPSIIGKFESMYFLFCRQ